MKMPGWDAYSIYTGNGLLLPAMIGQPMLLEADRLKHDLIHSARETIGPYGCGHSSDEPENVWISQNLWRDHLLRYLGSGDKAWAQRYWDLQVMSNTGHQSLGVLRRLPQQRPVLQPPWGSQLRVPAGIPPPG